jgi:hypothetical protein
MAPLPWHELEQRYNQLVQYHNPATAYADWEAFRAWFNATFTLLECFLEDAWNEQVEGETHIEYHLRSPKTKQELGPLAADVYTNHSDAKGVWHLGAYQHTQLPPAGAPTVGELLTFCQGHYG